MKVKEAFKAAVKSRAFLALWFLIFLQTILLVIFVAAYVRPSELQVPVHYSAFSSVQFYRDQWYYLLNFAIFGVMILGLNSFVALKLYAEKSRSAALAFLWVTATVLFISTILIVALLRVTSLLQ